MKKLIYKNNSIIYIILFLTIPLTIFSQIKIHKHLTTSDGLVNDLVTVITQDLHGYIWFGTKNGISRWDGNNFFNMQKHNGLTTSDVSDIKIAEDSTVYIATYGGGIVTYKNSILDTLDKTDGLATNWINKICIKKDGEILFGGNNGNITALRNGKLSQWINPKSLNNKIVSALYESNDGTIYIGLFQGGFYTFKENILKMYNAKNGMQNEDVNCFYEDDKGTIYFGTNLGIHEFKGGKINYLNRKWGMSFSSITQITNYNKIIYFPAIFGLISRRDGKTEIVGMENGLSFNEISSLYIDQFGSIYIGTFGNGVDIYEPNRIENFNKKNGLPDNKVWSITEDANGNLFFGTQKGLVFNDGNKQSTITLSNIYYANVAKSVIHSNDNTIYVGTTYGLNIITNGTNKKLTKDDGLIDTYIMDMAETHNGEILLGTRFGVVKINDKKVINITTDNGLNDNYVQAILVAKDSSIYYGTEHKGITHFRNGEYTYIRKADGLTDDNIQTLVQAEDGTIYIGTYEGGLNILRAGEITHIDITDGLSSNSILSIAIGDSNKVYVATFKGLNIIDFTTPKPKIKIVKSEDGLASDRCLKGALFIDKNKNIWIGTANGLSKYNPKFEKENKTPPKLYFTGIEIFNKNYPLEQFLKNPVLNYNQNYLKFSFDGINLSAPEKIKYQYRLSNIDKDWMETKNNSIQYTSLLDNDYILEIKAQNEWGYWSKPLQVKFTITPAWYNTWWFYLLMVLSVSAFITFIVSYRYRHLLALEKVRSKIAADLHDNIGSGLTEITFISEMLKPQIAENKIVESGISSITKISRNLVDDMRDIVWLVNPSKDSLKDLFLRLQGLYQETLRYSDVTILVKNIEKLENIRLSITLRQNIYLIFKEAINNAIKYSKSSEILVNVETKGKVLKISCSDNGVGFDKNNIKLGNGLNNIKDRAKLANGNINIKSEKGGGTQIIFTGKFGKLRI